MGYLFLGILCSALVSIVMRTSEKYISENVSMLAVNYVVCTVLAGAYAGFSNLFPQLTGTPFTMGLGVFTGFLYLLGFYLLQLNTKKNGVVLSAAFMKLGLVIPIVFAIAVFGEKPEILQVAGVILVLLSIILINAEKEQTIVQFKLGLILLLLVSGVSDGMSKVFESLGDPKLSGHFLFYTFGVALILCIFLALLKKQKLGKMELLFGILIGVPNYFSARMLLKSLSTVPAVIAYPTYSVGGILIVTLAGVCFFKEKLGKKQWMAIGMILAALVLLNI